MNFALTPLLILDVKYLDEKAPSKLFDCLRSKQFTRTRSLDFVDVEQTFEHYIRDR
jgi:hypothetical protein